MFSFVSAYAVEVSHPDAAPLMVLAAYLRNGFLHSAIREKGGAYGGGVMTAMHVLSVSIATVIHAWLKHLKTLKQVLTGC